MTVRDLNARYDNSIVALNNKAFRVLEIGEDRIVRGLMLSTNRRTSVSFDDEDLDTAPFKLGFVPDYPKAIYTYRTPERIYKQGLTERSLNYKYLTERIGGMGRPGLLGDVAFAISLDKLIAGEYRGFQECLDNVLDMDESPVQPFSRDFCLVGVDEDILLFYKSKNVGQVKGGDVVLDERYFFLKDVLEKRQEAA